MKKAFLSAAIFACCWTLILGEKGFLLTAPRVLTKEAVNDLYLDLFNVRDSGDVTISLLMNNNNTVITVMTSHVERGESRVVIPFPVPNVEEYQARIQINASFEGENEYEFSGEDKVRFRTAISKIIFIQTDKPIYKVGQEVKFRVLPVDARLKPLEKSTVGEVWVEDPNGFRIAQWKKAPLGQGILQLDFLLSNEPVLGLWKISVSIGTTTQATTFEVKEYVLPKFEVLIVPPAYVLADTEIIPIKVCGKYTYGQYVQGEVKLNITLESYYYWREKTPYVEADGKLEGACFVYKLNVSEIDINLQNTYRQIQVSAEVKEKGTGIIRKETKSISRTQSPLNLQFQSNSLEYFKAGLPYKGSIKVTFPDDTPAPEEPIEVCAVVTREREICNWFGTKKFKLCRNLTSDDNGIVTFTILPPTADSVSMNIEASSLRFTGKTSSPNKPTLYQPKTSRYLRPWYSPSASQLQIQGISEALSCGGKRKVQILFTADDSGDYKFYYEIVARDKVVRRDSVKVNFHAEESLEYHSEDALDAKKIQLVPKRKHKQPHHNRGEEEDVDENYLEAACEAVQEAEYVPFIGLKEIEIDVPAAYSPSFKLLVYYIRRDSETVADSQKFSVKKCFQNKVKMQFSDKVKQPGTKTTLTISASPRSLCGIKVVDKSVSLLDSSESFNKERIFEEIERQNHGDYYPRNHCSKRPQPGLLSKISGNRRIIPLPPNDRYASSSYEDAVTAFEIAGFIVISDLKLLTRPCKTVEQYRGPIAYSSRFAAAGSGGGMGMAAMDLEQSASGPNTKSAVDIRTFFPETWLFDIKSVGNEGVYVSKQTLPHTITEWVGSAVCINEADGLGLSNTTTINGFQEYFVSFTLPYSVVRGEKLPVIITIFNYIKECLGVSLRLEESPDFILLSDSAVTEICVCGGMSETYTFLIQPQRLGTLNLTVHSNSIDGTDVCGDGVVLSLAVARDAVRNPLLVVAEGFPITEVTNYLFCPKDSENGVFRHSFSYVPKGDNIVEDSARGYLVVTGDIMGPSIQGIDQLVQLPTGCGEQNIVLFAPNVYVLDYLEATNLITDKIKNKALSNLRTGYQRQLNYRHDDGSYSAFGKSDGQGSMFLTAFVFRSFAQAKKYIDIDANGLNQTSQWMISKQNKSGCFPEVGRTLSYSIKGGIKNTNTSGSLTAYVLSSLLTYGMQNEDVIEGALLCLGAEEDITPFQAALFAFTSALAGDNQRANGYIDDLFSRANTTGDVIYFPSRDGHVEVELETAAYAVLALLKLGKSVDESLPIIRYITTKRNSRGGFVGTQDTVLALEALSQFAKLISADPVDLEVQTSGSLTQTVTINEDDKILVKRYAVAPIPGSVAVEATGSGCGLLQSVLLYNTRTPLKLKYFSLQVETSRDQDSECKYATIDVCIRYLPEEKKSSMTLVQVKMVSGMVPEKELLNALRSNTGLGVKRVDFENNELVVYFDEITNTRTCFKFRVEEVVKIEDSKPATAKVYDYYSTEREEQTTYTIASC